MKKETQQVYDWDREGDFASGFHLIAKRTIIDLESCKSTMIESRKMKTEYDQAKSNFFLINSLSPMVVSFFTHPNNFYTRTIKIAVGASEHSQMTYGIHRIDGQYRFGLFYHPGTPKKPFVNPRPLTRDLLEALWTGENLPPGVGKNRIIVRNLGSKEQSQVLCHVIKQIKPSAK